MFFSDPSWCRPLLPLAHTGTSGSRKAIVVYHRRVGGLSDPAHVATLDVLSRVRQSLYRYRIEPNEVVRRSYAAA
jgi:hypothetical protein